MTDSKIESTKRLLASGVLPKGVAKISACPFLRCTAGCQPLRGLSVRFFRFPRCTFTIRHYRPGVQSLNDLAWQTDKGIVLATALVDGLRRQRVLLPSSNVIERVCAEAVTRANRRIHAALTESLTAAHRRCLDELLKRKEGGKPSSGSSGRSAADRRLPRVPHQHHAVEHAHWIADHR